jgi:archaellum component FlaF (FlaF/FlaG flagellin family)
MPSLNTKVVILVAVILICSIICLVLFIPGSPLSEISPLTETKKFDLSNLSLAYGQKPNSMGMAFEPVLTLTVKNLHSSSLTHMGLIIDGVNYGRTSLKIPPGQVQEESVHLPDIPLVSSRTYTIELTFTFADGSYQNSTLLHTTPQFKGQATVTELTLELTTFLSYFHIELKNTGNLPTTQATCSLGGREGMVLMLYQHTMPEEIIEGGFSGLSSSLFEEGKAYSVAVQLTYADGSKSTVQTSVIARSRATIQTRELTITYMEFVNSNPNTINIGVTNTGTSLVTISAVKINGATISTISGDRTLASGASGTITVACDWLAGNKYSVSLFASDGLMLDSYTDTA